MVELYSTVWKDMKENNVPMEITRVIEIVGGQKAAAFAGSRVML